jgi:hypothetical protein
VEIRVRCHSEHEVLGERPPTAALGGAATVVSNFRMEPGASRLFLLSGNGDPMADTLLKHDLLSNSAADFDYLLKLTTLAENLSRTALPEALKTLGLKGAPNVYKDHAPPRIHRRTYSALAWAVRSGGAT